MEKKTDLACYLRMMVDVLQRKKKVLEEVFSVTEEQEKILTASELDHDGFNATMEKKGSLINRINEMDDGFQALYNQIEKEIKEKGNDYSELIKKLQKLITDVTELGVKITALEHKNRTTLETRTNEVGRGKKSFKVSKQTADRYYRNMTGLNVDTPVFMDQKN